MTVSFWSIPCDEWCQERLCTNPNSVQHDVLCHAHSCFPGWWQWYDISYNITISIKRPKKVFQPAPGKPDKEPTITVKGQKLQVVDKFTYLGSTLSRVVHIDEEVNSRIAKASAALADYVVAFGIEVDQSWKSTKLWCCQHYCMHSKRGQFTNGTPKD